MPHKRIKRRYRNPSTLSQTPGAKRLREYRRRKAFAYDNDIPFEPRKRGRPNKAKEPIIFSKGK